MASSESPEEGSLNTASNEENETPAASQEVLVESRLTDKDGNSLQAAEEAPSASKTSIEPMDCDESPRVLSESSLNVQDKNSPRIEEEEEEEAQTVSNTSSEQKGCDESSVAVNESSPNVQDEDTPRVDSNAPSEKKSSEESSLKDQDGNPPRVEEEEETRNVSENSSEQKSCDESSSTSPNTEKPVENIEQSEKVPEKSTDGDMETEESESSNSKDQSSSSIDRVVFVEPPSGPMTPDETSRNPLDSDREDTRDSVTNEGNGTSKGSTEEENAAASSDSPLPKSSTPKENSGCSEPDAAEVITGDNSSSSNVTQAPTSANVSDKSNPETTSKSSSDGSASYLPGRNMTRVIYPKKNITDISELKVTKATKPEIKSCLHCTQMVICDIVVTIGGSQCYLCSEECLKLHKVNQANAIQQLKKNTPTIPDSDRQEGMEARICVNCNANVSLLSEDHVLSWEAMEFCNEDCLGKYQTKMWSHCSACKKDVHSMSMGKYCVRFGNQVKQFCTVSCLEEFKKGIKVCSFCQKDLTEDDGGFLAPIGEKGQFKDFCSQVCLDEFYCLSQNMPSGGLKVEHCGVCDKNTLVQVQVVTGPDKTVNLCSTVCLKAFKFVYSAVSTAACYMCKKYFDKALPSSTTIYYENELLPFCSKACMNISILSKRKIVACSWCKVKKYNFDMIRRKTSAGVVSNWCSINCMNLYRVSANVVTSNKSSKPCTRCGKVDIPSIHLTMSDATVRNFCSMDCVNRYQASFPSVTQANGTIVTKDASSKLQSLSTAKKTPEIKVISSASMNGLQGSGLRSPSGGTLLAGVSGASPGPQPSLGGQVESPPAAPALQHIVQRVLVLPKPYPEMANAAIQTRPKTANKSLNVRVIKATKGCQAGEVEKKEGPILVPVPVPIYVPCPMAMYSLPSPVPLPIPIPVAVPIFIPTTKGSAEEILADIQRIRDEMPGNPYEAEVLMMAQLASLRSSTAAEEEAPSDGGSGGRGQKRGLQDSEDENPPHKKRKEVTEEEDNLLDSAINHLAVSQQPMSLKETLAVSAWKNFAQMNGETVDLLKMNPEELARALKNFIKNAKIPGGTRYTPDQKYFLMLGIQCYLTENDRQVNIFFDEVMEPFIKALDEDALSFQTLFGPHDYIITRVEEENLWEAKQLGPHSPFSLLATLIYFNTKYFNLTTVEEHKKLTFKDIVKQWKQMPATNSSTNGNSIICATTLLKHLRYNTPDSDLEANPKKKPYYEQFANKETPYRCPITIYEFYVSKCPKSAKMKGDTFYLNPEKSCDPSSPIWYSPSALDDEVLAQALNRFKMVKEINLAID